MASRLLTRLLFAGAALWTLRSTLAKGRPMRGQRGGDLPAPERARASYGAGSLSVVVLAGVAFVAATGLTVLLGVYGPVADLAGRDFSRPSAFVTLADRGDAARGRAAIVRYECRACHTVPGLPRLSDHGVGPSLVGVGGRAYIAGVLPNRPENLVAWIRNPPLFAPDTAMPDMNIDEATATDIAAYLQAH